MSGIKFINVAIRHIYGVLSISTAFSSIRCNSRNTSSIDYEMNPVYYNTYYIVRGLYNGILWPYEGSQSRTLRSFIVKWEEDAFYAHRNPEDRKRFMKNFTPKIYEKEYYQTHMFYYPRWLQLEKPFKP